MKKFTYIFFVFSCLMLVSTSTAHALTPDDYIYQKLEIKTDSAPTNIKDKISNEVQNIISQPSRLQPYYQDVGITEGWLYWGYPGEEFSILSDALPFLQDPLKTQVTTYLKTQMQLYPPYSYSFYPQNCCLFDLTSTPRREWYPLNISTGFNVWPPIATPPAGIYVVWQYANATGDWQYVTDRWANIDNFYANYVNANPTISSYEDLLATIGYIRLATHENQTARISAAVTRITNAFPALADVKNMITTLDPALNTEVQPIHDWTIPLFISNRADNALVAIYGPELGRFLKNEAIDPVPNLFESIYALAPQWYLFKADYPGFGNADATGSRIWNGQEVSWLIGSGYGENNLIQPDIAWTLFLLRADVYNDPPDKLAYLTDAPLTKVGDIYYIDKLVKTAQAYSATCWTDVRSGQQISCQSPPSTSATPAPVQTACQKADINQDNLVDLSDYSLLASNFLKTNPSNPRADINTDGVVDLTDYSLLAIQFLKACQ